MILDVRGISTFCDYFVVLSGTSLRHVNALAHGIVEDCAKERIKALSGIPAEDESGWTVLDYVSVVVHVFHKPVREFYALERLWSDAKRVRIPRL
ncbi:MAG: ribosome silencing factor [Candidatus Omnitrophica bacterium]|nr:ribosome silencing factor [Candidatus Omnitrophota bacterium]